MSLRFKSTVLATALATALCSSASAAVLSLSTGDDAIVKGSPFAVSITLADVVTPLIGAFDLHVNYNPRALSFSHYELGNELGELDLGEALDLSMGLIGSGTVHLGELSLLAELGSQPLSFTLGTLYFTALDRGSSSVSLSMVTLANDWGEQVAAELSGLRINAVPEPASAALLLAGLGLLGASSLRRRQD